MIFNSTVHYRSSTTGCVQIDSVRAADFGEQVSINGLLHSEKSCTISNIPHLNFTAVHKCHSSLLNCFFINSEESVSRNLSFFKTQFHSNLLDRGQLSKVESRSQPITSPPSFSLHFFDEAQGMVG